MSSLESADVTSAFSDMYLPLFLLRLALVAGWPQALRLATTLSDSVQLAEKVVCMSKLSNVLGNDAGKASQNVLGSVAGQRSPWEGSNV